MPRTGFRLRVSIVGRVWRTAVMLLGVLLFVPAALNGSFELWWRIGAGLAALSSLVGLRLLWGAVLVVRPAGLRIQRNWPLRRDVAWYRLESIEVVPGVWNLDLVLNSGERLVLPPVHDLERLYALVEQHRAALDA